jgi:hypothetical protein
VEALMGLPFHQAFADRKIMKCWCAKCKTSCTHAFSNNFKTLSPKSCHDSVPDVTPVKRDETGWSSCILVQEAALPLAMPICQWHRQVKSSSAPEIFSSF